MRWGASAAVALAVVIAGSSANPALAQDAAGDWHGALMAAPGYELPLAIHLKKAGAGGLTGTLDNPDQNVFGEPLSDLSMKDGKLTFTGARAHGVFVGTWDAASHSWKGALTLSGRDYLLSFVAGDLPPPPPAVQGLDGEWDGALDFGTGLRLRLAFHIVTDAHGTHVTYDGVDQGVYGAPATSISRNDDHVRLVIKAINAVYEAQLQDGATLSGVFTQNGSPLPLGLKRLPDGQASPWPKPAGPPPAPVNPADWKTPSDAEIRQLLTDRIDRQRQGVGIVVGVIDANGRRVIAYGKSDSANGRALDGDSEFEIGSISKVFTALVLADMVGKGEVNLDDPIAKYLPAGVTAPTKDGKAITLVDLATHTSGLPRMPTNFAPKDPQNPFADYTMEQLWSFLSSYQLPRDPGDQWEYSNLGFGLLGDLLARRAGTDYETLVKTRVLRPLGLASTTITLTPDEMARLARGHDSSLRPVANWDLPSLAGAGALRSTANDLMTFLAAEMGLAGLPLKADMAETLQVRRPTTAPTLSQALGWEVLHTPSGDLVQHGGGTGGYHTLIVFNPKTRAGVVVLTNAETLAGADDIAMHILVGSRVIDLPPPPPPPPERRAIALGPKALDALVGRYQLAPQVIVTITREGDRLMAQLTGQSAAEVFPESPTEVFWKMVDAQATFTLGPGGRAASLTLHQSGRDLPAPRVP